MKSRIRGLRNVDFLVSVWVSILASDTDSLGEMAKSGVGYLKM